jgi:nitrogen regulatory protein PII
MRVEIVVMNDLAVPDVIDEIALAVGAANPDQITNGSIFVMPLDEWVQISANRPMPSRQTETIHSREAS